MVHTDEELDEGLPVEEAESGFSLGSVENVDNSLAVLSLSVSTLSPSVLDIVLGLLNS